MINKRKIQIQEIKVVNEIDSLTCDVCKKEFLYDREHALDTQEFHHIYFTGGYGSKFGDGCSIRIDVCDNCLYEIFSDVYYEVDEDGEVVPPTVKEKIKQLKVSEEALEEVKKKIKDKMKNRSK
jgi:protein involved in polysaccharide export with SLBB domain